MTRELHGTDATTNKHDDRHALHERSVVAFSCPAAGKSGACHGLSYAAKTPQTLQHLRNILLGKVALGANALLLPRRGGYR